MGLPITAVYAALMGLLLADRVIHLFGLDYHVGQEADEDRRRPGDRKRHPAGVPRKTHQWRRHGTLSGRIASPTFATRCTCW